ncbi:MAG TPA: ABC transporter permease [Isosphaeraceae bacterium]|jgi:ABC-type transport system involved in multi-copper enzyme maturation permease subunit|nr:ABC transporter permease [Isosphaeraceae bacterium]
MRFGLGPVFAYEWLTTSRRWQTYAMRALFVTALLLALGVVWWTNVAGKTLQTIRSQADVGVIFFYAIIGTQITLILLAAPAATAGSICLDKARGTLSHVLVTDLSDSEIVLGKLAARLLPALALVACTLPMMAICTLLGGLDPDALFGAFLITLGLAVLGACLALAFSVWASKTHEVLMGTYAVWGLWLMVGPITSHLSTYLPATGTWIESVLHVNVSGQIDDLLGWMSALENVDPYRLAFAPYITPKTARFQHDVNFFVGVLVISAVLAALSVWKLRPAYIKGLSRGVRIRKGRLDRAIRRVMASLPCPPLDGNPVLWREWHRNRPSRLSRLVWVIYLGLAASFSLTALASAPSGALAAWVNGMQVAIGMMLLSVSASTSLAEERVRGSLDVLLATPLSTFTILAGKWWGTYRLVLLLGVLPTLVAAGQALSRLGDGLYLGHVLLILGLILAYGAGVTSLGLALATWVRRIGRAVGLCLGAVVFMTVGWLFLMIELMSGPRGESLGMGSPFMGAGELTFEICNNMTQRNDGWAAAWIVLYLIAASLLFVATWITFNRCLGRASTYDLRPHRHSEFRRPILAAVGKARTAPARQPSET